MEMRRGAERLPGRRGEGKDILLMPLSFREYMLVLREELDGILHAFLVDLIRIGRKRFRWQEALKKGRVGRCEYRICQPSDEFGMIGGYYADSTDWLL